MAQANERVINEEEIVPDIRRIPERMLDRPNDIDAIPDDAIPNIEAHIADTLSELGERAEDRVKIQIWRVNPKNYLDRAFLIEMLPQEFSIQRISEDFGGGMFQAVVRAPRINKDGSLGGAASVIVKAPRFRIVGAEKEPVRKPAEQSLLPAQASGNPADVARVMMEGFREIMTELKTALVKPEKSTMDMARELAELKGLFAPPPMPAPVDPLAQALQQMSLIEKMRALMNPSDARPLPDNPSDSAMLLQITEKILPLIVEAVNKDKAPKPVMLPNAPADNPDQDGATETPAPAIPNAQPVEDDPVNLMQQAQALMFKAYVGDLVANARANNDIEPIAQRVYDQATEELWEFLQAPDWLDKLAAINKDVRLFPAWFQKMHARILELDKDEPDA